MTTLNTRRLKMVRQLTTVTAMPSLLMTPSIIIVTCHI